MATTGRPRRVGAEVGGRGRGELAVLAAASLTNVFDELATPFEEEHDADVVFSFGSSADLASRSPTAHQRRPGHRRRGLDAAGRGLGRHR